MLIRHSALFTAGKLLPGLLGMATTALLTRLLDPAAYGRYGVSLVVMTFGSAVLFDWLGLAYLRVGQSKPGAFGTVAWLFAGVALLTTAGAALAWSAGLASGPTGPAILAGLLLMVCYAGFELAARLPIARGQPGRFLLMNAGRGVLSLAAATGAAWLTRDPAWTACGTAVGTAAGMALGGVLAGTGALRLSFDTAQARAVLSFGLPVAASLALAGASASGLRLLLDALDSPAALGLYTAGFLLVQNTLSVVAAGIAAAGYPAAVRALEHGDMDAARRHVTQTWSLLLAVLAPMALGMALTAPGLATLLVGPRYVAGVARLTPWLALAGLLSALRAQGLDYVFQLARRPGHLTLVSALAAMLALGLAVALVPRCGPQGAAVAAVAAAVGSGAAALALGRRHWTMDFPLRTVLGVLGACTAMALAVSAMPNSLSLQVAAGIASYATAATVFNLLGLRDACWRSSPTPDPRLASNRPRGASTT